MLVDFEVVDDILLILERLNERLAFQSEIPQFDLDRGKSDESVYGPIVPDTHLPVLGAGCYLIP